MLYLLLQVGSLPGIALITLVVRRTKFVRQLRKDERRGVFEKDAKDDDEGSADSESVQPVVSRSSSSGLSLQPLAGRGGYPNPLGGLFGTVGGLLHRPRANRRAPGSSADYLLDGITSVRNSHFIGIRSEKHRAHVRRPLGLAGI